MKQLLIFDLDDTLIHTHLVYLQVTAEIIDRMEELGICDDNLYYTLDSYDQETVEEDGCFKQDAFPRAVHKTYDFYCQKLNLEYRDEVAAELNEIAWQINSIKYEPVDGAKLLLDILAESGKYNMVLLTRGDEEIQKKKVKDNSLGNYFDEVIVVPNKDARVFGDVMAKYGVKSSDTWIIGNSVRSEIIPAQQLGANHILTAVTESWSYEAVDNVPKCPVVENLPDCLSIIENNACSVPAQYKGEC